MLHSAPAWDPRSGLSGALAQDAPSEPKLAEEVR